MVQITYAHPHFAFAGRKQRIKNSDWIDAFGKIAQLVSKKELDQLVEKTVKDIKKKTKGKKAAYAWSGGKDSLVLGELCQRAGIIPDAFPAGQQICGEVVSDCPAQGTGKILQRE